MATAAIGEKAAALLGKLKGVLKIEGAEEGKWLAKIEKVAEAIRGEKRAGEVAGEFEKVSQRFEQRFQKLEEELYGLPIYKQEWFKKQRAQKKRSS